MIQKQEANNRNTGQQQAGQDFGNMTVQQQAVAVSGGKQPALHSHTRNTGDNRKKGVNFRFGKLFHKGYLRGVTIESLYQHFVRISTPIWKNYTCFPGAYRV